jgi:TPR repeat protein
MSHTRRFLFAGALCLAALAHAEPARIEAAHQAYHQGQFDRSLMLYEQLAAQGNAEAAERAGYMLMQGAGVYGPAVRPDPARATAWLEQAAGAGRAHAVFVLGMTNSAD